VRLPYVVQRDLAYACRRTRCLKIVGGSCVLKAVRRLRVAVNGCSGHTGLAFTNLCPLRHSKHYPYQHNEGALAIRIDGFERLRQSSDCK
jgi:hypothetical protein